MQSPQKLSCRPPHGLKAGRGRGASGAGILTFNTQDFARYKNIEAVNPSAV